MGGCLLQVEQKSMWVDGGESNLTDDLHATSILPKTLYTDSLQPADGTQVHIQYERRVLQRWME